MTETYWHFVRNNRRLQHDMSDMEVTPDLTLSVNGEPVMCQHGLHASKRALDALKYAPGNVVCKVTLGGTIVHDTDKSVASKRTVLAMADATRALHEFAIWCAERALAKIPEGQRDPRSLAVLAVKRRWLDGEATNNELIAARSAAEAAAWAIAWDKQADELERRLNALLDMAA